MTKGIRPQTAASPAAIPFAAEQGGAPAMEAAAAVTISLNGDRTKVSAAASLAQIIHSYQLPQHHVAVERNLEIVPRSLWNSTTLADGDRVEIVHFVGGG